MATHSVKFWDRMAKRYSKQPIADESAYQKKLEVTQSYLNPDMRLLEFGCGTGSTALIHAPLVKEILAIDVSANMLAIAQEKADAQGIQNVQFKVQTIEDFDSHEGQFDAVLGMSILHLLGNKEAAIEKVFHLLKPGGLFISSTVCADKMIAPLRWAIRLGYAVGLLPHFKGFSKENLEASMVQAGFDLDYVWRPGENKAVFIVAKKPH